MNILITGGTGSLGQALTAKLLSLKWPNKICIYSRDEHKQEQMRIKFGNDPRLRFFLGDIRDISRLRLACNDMQLIVHAAALKIVGSGEYNPFEVIKTNILGAQNLVECVIENRNESLYNKKVLAISTDKACKPVNLYGASKLCAEKIFITANNIVGKNGPLFSVARYGNVANSNGSVIPLFKRQIANNEPLTITDERMTRFWITLDEATDFILRCLDRMYGGEIFVPAMPSFSIKELGMVMMKDYLPEKQYFNVIGIRAGEKLHEEIITKEESSITDWDVNTNTYIINAPEYENKVLNSIDREIKDEGIASNSGAVHMMLGNELEEKINAL